jgi:heme-degrading monooxygenase HmoA
MHARVSRFQDDPTRLDEAEQYAMETIVPAAQQQPGFLGLLSLIDRDSGASLAITLWESEQAMRDSEAAANRLREDSAAHTDAQITSVERYEVSLRVGL